MKGRCFHPCVHAHIPMYAQCLYHLQVHNHAQFAFLQSVDGAYVHTYSARVRLQSEYVPPSVAGFRSSAESPVNLEFLVFRSRSLSKSHSGWYAIAFQTTRNHVWVSFVLQLE